MTYEQINGIMEEMGLPFAYHHFAEGESPEPPFRCFRQTQSDNFSADGTAYFKVADVDIELYTDKKNPETEKRVEKMLSDAGIFFDKEEVWISSEKLYEVVFGFAVSDEDMEDTYDS